MNSITIRKIDPALKEQLRVRAARHGNSKEAEVRHILQVTLNATEQRRDLDLYESVRNRFAPLGGADLDLPAREPARSSRLCLMFLLDTNVLSAIMSRDPVAAVQKWMSGQIADDLFTASVCEAEILSSLASSCPGRHALAVMPRGVGVGRTTKKPPGRCSEKISIGGCLPSIPTLPAHTPISSLRENGPAGRSRRSI